MDGEGAERRRATYGGNSSELANLKLSLHQLHMGRVDARQPDLPRKCLARQYVELPWDGSFYFTAISKSWLCTSTTANMHVNFMHPAFRDSLANSSLCRELPAEPGHLLLLHSITWARITFPKSARTHTWPQQLQTQMSSRVERRRSL